MYITHIHSTCTKVGSDAHQAHKGGRGHRGSLALLCCPSCPPIHQVVRGGGEAGPAPSLSVWAASGVERPSRSAQPRLRPTRAAALIDRTALRAASAAESRVFGGDLGGGDGWRRVCAISGDQPSSLATDIDLWRCSQKRHQQACERRSADAKRAGKEWRAGVLKVAEPSSELRRAMERPLTGADDRNSPQSAPRRVLRPLG